jgi:DNA-binding beta-propeller fold protein YncE
MRLPFPCLALALLVLACGPTPAERQAAAARARADSIARAVAESAVAPLAGVPPAADSTDLYAAAGAGMVDSIEALGRPAVYVPLGGAGAVAVIDPRTYKVVRTFATGAVPQHVVPSYDQRRLWVANDRGNSLTPIDPRTATPGKNVVVQDPYNLYFTPDGRYALVVAERLQRLDFRDPQTLALHDTVHVDCPGVDHMEFTKDGRWALATCEFSGKLLKLDVATHRVAGYLELDPGGLGKKGAPQDVRSAPDGRLFYVADMMANGVYVVDPVAFRRVAFIPTGKGTHGIYPSRDGTVLYVSNRGSNHVWGPPRGPGSVTVLDPKTWRIVATWRVPGGGSPDMGNVTADGTELWLSGRYDAEVYVFNTATGALLHRIPVGRGPHGLTVWPQPGRYSLGHTGNMR